MKKKRYTSEQIIEKPRKAEVQLNKGESVGKIGVTTMHIEPESPWENGYNESSNGTVTRRALKQRDFLYTQGDSGAHRRLAS